MATIQLLLLEHFALHFSIPTFKTWCLVFLNSMERLSFFPPFHNGVLPVLLISVCRYALIPVNIREPGQQDKFFRQPFSTQLLTFHEEKQYVSKGRKQHNYKSSISSQKGKTITKNNKSCIFQMTENKQFPAMCV